MNEQTPNAAKSVVDQMLGQGTVDRVQGKANELLGKAKVKAGELLGSDTLNVEGLSQRVDGAAQQLVGKTKALGEKLGDNIEEVGELLREKGLDVLHQTETTLEHAKDKATEVYAELRDKTGTLVESMQHKLKDAGSKAKDLLDGSDEKPKLP